jgi:hypothetical protein
MASLLNFSHKEAQKHKNQLKSFPKSLRMGSS